MSDSSVFLSLILTFARLLKIIFITTWCKFLIQHNKKNFSCWNNIKKASLKLCKFSIIKIRNKIFPCRLYAEGSMSLLVSLLEILLLLRLKIKFFISTAINTLYWGEWIAFLIYFFLVFCLFLVERVKHCRHWISLTALRLWWTHFKSGLFTRFKRWLLERRMKSFF